MTTGDATGRRKKLLVMRTAGAVLVLFAIGIFLIGPVIGLRRTGARLEKMKSPTPADLREGVEDAVLASVVLAGLLGSAGAALLIVALVRLHGIGDE